MGDLDWLVGHTVAEIRYWAPGTVRIVFDVGPSEEPAAYADIGGSELLRGTEFQSIDPAPDTLAPILALAGVRVEAVGLDEGTLTIEFADGSRLSCAPHGDYEAWQVVGSSRASLVVCMPGGELAVWNNEGT